MSILQISNVFERNISIYTVASEFNKNHLLNRIDNDFTIGRYYTNLGIDVKFSVFEFETRCF